MVATIDQMLLSSLLLILNVTAQYALVMLVLCEGDKPAKGDFILDSIPSVFIDPGFSEFLLSCGKINCILLLFNI